MESLEIGARTVEEAIQMALGQLGVSREDVRVDVLSEGRPGDPGTEPEEARIRVELLEPAPPEPEAPGYEEMEEIARRTLGKLLELLEVDASVVPQAFQATNGDEQVSAPLSLDVEGDDLGILIGRRGQTLACLQYLLRLMVSHQTKIWNPIVVDVEGYKKRRSEALQALAVRMAEQVKRRGTPFTLEPMPAYERRIIHLALADHPDVTTESTGLGELRKVVIIPERN